MEYRLPIRNWHGVAALISALIAAPSYAQDRVEANARFREAKQLYLEGQFFQSARYAFSAQLEDASLKPEAYSHIFVSLMRAGLAHGATYFFIKTLETKERAASQRVLAYAEELLAKVGPDVLRRHLVEYTRASDYDETGLGAYWYSFGKKELLEGNSKKAVEYLRAVPNVSFLYPFAQQALGTALALQRMLPESLERFKNCADRARSYKQILKSEAEDLENRCLAGVARVHYELERFYEAERAYEKIPKKSFVWPDILFEQAWNAYSKREYNRALGKLVTYKSPALQFLHNSEVDVLRAISYTALCLYDDAEVVISDFNSRFSKLAGEIKRFVEGNNQSLPSFFELGQQVLKESLYTKKDLNRLMNRFVRSPYFQRFATTLKEIEAERVVIRKFDQLAANQKASGGFPGFLDEVYRWRKMNATQLGGAFVKNSLLDHHATLISDYEKMSFIKLEILGRMKERLLTKKAPAAERLRGNLEPLRRDDQFYWRFNGEFWNDELGDYIFGLESQCRAS